MRQFIWDFRYSWIAVVVVCVAVIMVHSLDGTGERVEILRDRVIPVQSLSDYRFRIRAALQTLSAKKDKWSAFVIFSIRSPEEGHARKYVYVWRVSGSFLMVRLRKEDLNKAEAARAERIFGGLGENERGKTSAYVEGVDRATEVALLALFGVYHPDPESELVIN